MTKNTLLIIVLSLIFPLSLQAQKIEKWDFIELEYQAKNNGNQFIDVELSAEFQFKNRTYFAEGFFDGNNTWKIRFMPDEQGQWTYVTKSNIKKLNNKSGTFTCIANTENNHGPVSVRDTFHFGYADGRPFYPLGTTAYAWVHQPDELKQQTLNTLRENAFNKIRMTVFPKQYSIYIQNEPPFYPFEGSKQEGWDFTRFNVDFFQHFENYVDSLRQLNIEADIILFHPYDYGKWGFDQMNQKQNVRYLRYLIARLAAYRNVWWSMANEYDMMHKPEDEWDLYFRTIQTYDPYSHLLSIHNGQGWYNHSKPWITHLSIQTPYLHEVQDWRELYQKPVVNDELVYEGDVPMDWGNITPQEMVHRFWIMYTRGGYASHGETYKHPENILWWSKGGKLYGKSPERLAFLFKIMKQAPQKGLQPFHDEWNKKTFLYKNDDFFLHYFGHTQQTSAILKLSENKKYTIEVIDCWEMTIEKLDGTFSGKTEIPLPGKQFVAVRVAVE